MMMSFPAKAYQFLTRRDFPNVDLGRLPATNHAMGIQLTLNCSIVPKPFEIVFASIFGQRSDIGAWQTLDPYLDRYADARWPKCLFADVEITIPDSAQLEKLLPEMMLNIHDTLRQGVATHPIFNAGDQLSKRIGYRRSYYAQQWFDISGIRRPHPSEYYHPTGVGELLGPGVISAPLGNRTMEMVWSQIIPFPNVTNITTDRPRLKAIIDDMRKHHNGYHEFRDAYHHLAERQEMMEIKAAVRAAASGIDAILRFYCGLHSVKFPNPKRGISFDDKIEQILQATGMPSYKTIAPLEMDCIRSLYRARNTMHEGDCYTTDASGARIPVDVAQARKFIEAAERLAIWLDARA
jgi:hypothetical protein